VLGLAALPSLLLLVGDLETASSAEMVVTEEDRKRWSYLPLTSPPLPAVKRAASVRTPVDRFILARLEQKKLGLSPQASAQKLVRRIYFDLIGLPPAPEQVESFVRKFARNSQLAVESLVDQLLASPHYGERWARHWLDVARYADSDGQESDAEPAHGSSLSRLRHPQSE